MEFPWASAIIATVISVGISLLVLTIREKKIEPDKWKKNTKLLSMERQLEALGILVNLLQSTQQKAKRQNINKQANTTHLFEVPEDSTIFRKFFSEKRYLLPEDIVNEYLKIEANDTYFGLSDKGKQSALILDLSNMQNLAESKFVNLKKEYEDLTGYKLS